MGGGLMQLVAYGAQDIYLTGNPQITFFKVVYRRHTNFSMETIMQTINGSPSAGGSSTVTISRNGDLVHKIYVCSTDQNVTFGSHIIKDCELEIGGQRIDKQTREWNQVWWELTTPEDKALGFKCMIGDLGQVGSTGVRKVQIPLNFWFCRNPGLALPLIALQYHEVKLKFNWSGDSTDIQGDEEVWCDYIYLDTDERRRFAQVSHEYLIEQVQIQSGNGSNVQKLNFNHPVKELIWTSDAHGFKQSLTSSTGYVKSKLILNGHDRFAYQTAEYFQLRQPYDYHTVIPHQNLPSSGKKLTQNFVQDGVSIFASSDISTSLVLGGVTYIPDGGLAATAEGNVKSIGTVVSTNHKNAAALTTGQFVISAAGADESLDAAFDGTSGNIAADTETNHLVYSFLTADLKSDFIHSTANLAHIPVKVTVQRLRSASEVAATNSDNNQPGGTLGDVSTYEVECEIVASKAGGGGGSGNYSTKCAHLIFSADLFNLLAVNKDTAFGEPFPVAVNPIGTSLFTEGVGFNEANQQALSIVDIKLVRGTHSFEEVGRCTRLDKGINVYSFALKPEEHQPSGTCNFSRIDNAQLDFATGGAHACSSSNNIYAVNYNVLRIMSGMGGLAYSN